MPTDDNRYGAPLPPRQKMVAGAATGAICLAVGALLIGGLRVDVAKQLSSSIKALQINAPKPPEPPNIPSPEAEDAMQEKAAPPALKAKAAPVVAPKPIISPLKPTPPAANKASDGSEAQAGAAPTAGEGTGAGGIGDGTGGGGNGSGRGGGTRPVWQSGSIRDRDYPRSASSARRGGEVETRFTVETDGRVTGCRISRSSGDADIDATTCRLIEQRFRFRPATNRTGEPIASQYGWRQSWWLEKR